MNILLFGATGPTGLQVAKQSLERGHTVTAFVRDAGRLTTRDDRLRVVTGDTTRDAGAIGEAVRGQDAVVSALGRHLTLKSDRLIERSLRLIVPAMERAGVRRLVLLSAFGVGASGRDAPLLQRLMQRLLLRDIFADKLVGESLVRQSGLDWSLVYPVMLTDGPLTRQYRAGERLELHGLPKISRADVAHFIVGELESGAWLRRTAVLSY